MATLTEIIRKEFETYATENHQKPDIRYLDSPLVTKYVKAETGKESIYAVRDAEIAKRIYLSVQRDIDNINAHQNYSAALLHYCKFLILKIKVVK
jgi:hypothetical protein